jgi:hypothetical protein
MVEYVTQRFLEGRVERSRKRQKCPESIREQLCSHSIHALCRWHLSPRSYRRLLFSALCAEEPYRRFSRNSIQLQFVGETDSKPLRKAAELGFPHDDLFISGEFICD